MVMSSLKNSNPWSRTNSMTVLVLPVSVCADSSVARPFMAMHAECRRTYPRETSRKRRSASMTFV